MSDNNEKKRLTVYLGSIPVHSDTGEVFRRYRRPTEKCAICGKTVEFGWSTDDYSYCDSCVTVGVRKAVGESFVEVA